MLNIYNVCLDDGVSDCMLLQEGPPVAEMMTVMGKDNTLQRLQHSAKLLQSPSWWPYCRTSAHRLTAMLCELFRGLGTFPAYRCFDKLVLLQWPWRCYMSVSRDGGPCTQQCRKTFNTPVIPCFCWVGFTVQTYIGVCVCVCVCDGGGERSKPMH